MVLGSFWLGALALCEASEGGFEAAPWNKEAPDGPKAAAKYHMMRGEHDQALESLHRVLEQNPADMEAKLDLAVTLLELSRYEKAVEVLREVIETLPDSPKAHYVLSVALENLKPPLTEEAEQHRQRALELGYRIPKRMPNK